MEAVTPTLGPTAHHEPIPGYVLTERLGSGGYGEVWEAQAPGGLRKAVKFVYGSFDEARAQRELKSLNRIKEVRHPFLLSIERIEVITGRLIIVTELAQGCVKTRFDECRKTGMEGIPREELLGYLRDTAEALDFIHERHNLQHLDIKPENLLLVGDHVKLADFGLLKKLNESASLLGGLTPLYCSPEVLEGRPNRHSDQYALAIVYQEMLTGESPFSGKTMAQLAAQHLHATPIVAALPPCDRPLVLRALSKKPDKRFPSCRALIDGLRDSHAAGSNAPSRRVRAAADSRPGVAKTQSLSPADPANEDSSGDSPLLPVAIRDLARIDLASAETTCRPTVLIGVGGTGGRILSHLQRRLHARFGEVADVPALQMLLFDTDSKDLTAATCHRSDGCLPARSTLAIPLRGAKDYRSQSKHLLEWISRRWLYNIPRSHQTEGLRPLGRLAFVDHCKKVFDRLRKTVEAAVREEAANESRRASGFEFRPGPPDVFVIASIAGGTGSGTVLDLGYALRKLLDEMGLPARQVCGILTHSTSRKAASRDLAVANTLACLKELSHYCRPQHGYPGDPACDLPAFYGDSAPFHHAYLVHLGDELNDNQFDAAADRMAEYLYQNILPPAAQFFRQAREGVNSERESPLVRERLRTLGVALFGAGAVDRADGGKSAPAEAESAASQCEAAASQCESAAPQCESAASQCESAPSTCDPAPTSTAAPEAESCVDDTQQLAEQLESLVQNCRGAVPELATCGGSRRSLIIVPADASREHLAKANPDLPEESLTFAEHARREIIVCQEIEDVPLRNVVTYLVGERRDYLEVADRLHTRIDVEWSPW